MSASANAQLLPVWIATRKRHYRAIRQSPEDKANEILDHAQATLMHAGHERLRRENPAVRRPNFTDIFGGGEQFDTRIDLEEFATPVARFWTVPEPLTVIRFANDETVLLIGAIGFDVEGIASLLRTVTRLEAGSALLNEHQRTMDKQLEELMRQNELDQ